jgi:hypothetical protein
VAEICQLIGGISRATFYEILKEKQGKAGER